MGYSVPLDGDRVIVGIAVAAQMGAGVVRPNISAQITGALLPGGWFNRNLQRKAQCVAVIPAMGKPI